MDERLEVSAGRLLIEKGLTLALAESCTGGLMAARLTDVPGSSAYFKGSVVAYDNEVKYRVLGVSRDLLDIHGAVSSVVARGMAMGCRGLLGADLGIGVTGIAGPGGGSAEKPVGLVYVALAAQAVLLERELRLAGSRLEIRRQSVDAALEMLGEYLFPLSAPGMS